MRSIAIALAMGILAVAASAQVLPTFTEMKGRLNEKSLPIVNLTVDIASVSKPVYTSAIIEIVDPLARTEGSQDATYNCKVKYRGNTSLRYDKKSFNVKMLNASGKSLDVGVMGIREDDAWILDAMAIDRMRMRNRLNFDIWNDMSGTPYSTDYDQRNGTRGYFVELFINGKYHGLYCLSDKVNRKLLGIKKADKDSEGYPVIKGVMYKGDQWSDATRLNGYYEQSMTGPSWNEWELDYPDDYPCEEAYSPLRDFIDFCASSSDGKFADQTDEYMYIDNVADYQVFVLAQGLRDNLMKNSYLSIVNINKGHRMMITPWDLDCSLGGEWDGTYYNEPANLEKLMDVGLFRRLWLTNLRGYQTTVADRWRTLSANGGVLSAKAFDKRVDTYVRQIMESGAWAREYAVWNGNPVELKEDLDLEADYIKEWYATNTANLAKVVFGGIESGISSVDDTRRGSDGTLYNMMGQKVNSAYKGIVISGGRKHMSNGAPSIW